jgi:hypothetical protein
MSIDLRIVIEIVIMAATIAANWVYLNAKVKTMKDDIISVVKRVDEHEAVIKTMAETMQAICVTVGKIETKLDMFMTVVNKFIDKQD